MFICGKNGVLPYTPHIMEYGIRQPESCFGLSATSRRQLPCVPHG